MTWILLKQQSLEKGDHNTLYFEVICQTKETMEITLGIEMVLQTKETDL